MKNRSTALRLGVIAVALLATLSFVGCFDSDDDGTTNPGNGNGTGGGPAVVTVPASWSGVWMMTFAPTAGARMAESDVDVQVICGGTDAMDLLMGDEDGDVTLVDLQGSWDDTNADVTLTVDVVNGDCTVRRVIVLDATLSGEGFTGTVTETDTYGANCSGTDETEMGQISAARLLTTSPGCDSAMDDTLPSDWAGDWNITDSPTDCDTGLPSGNAEAFDESLCAGDSAAETFYEDAPTDDSFFIQGGFTSTAVDVIAIESKEEEGCPLIEVEIWNITRDGESMTGTQKKLKYYTDAAGCSAATECQYSTFAGTRTSSVATDCGI